MNNILTFGDVFNYKGKEYVFLVATEDVIYTARIFTRQESFDVQTLFNKTRNTKANALYCFVMLDTEEFRERMANFYNTGKDDVSVYAIKSCTLDAVDIQKMKEEILADDAPLPKALREHVRALA
jgi:hypothetical protein